MMKDFLSELGDMAEKMMAEKQGAREKQFTKDTSQAFSHTCRGMVALTEYLLNSSHEYVCLGHFPSNPI